MRCPRTTDGSVPQMKALILTFHGEEINDIDRTPQGRVVSLLIWHDLEVDHPHIFINLSLSKFVSILFSLVYSPSSHKDPKQSSSSIFSEFRGTFKLRSRSPSRSISPFVFLSALKTCFHSTLVASLFSQFTFHLALTSSRARGTLKCDASIGRSGSSLGCAWPRAMRRSPLHGHAEEVFQQGKLFVAYRPCLSAHRVLLQQTCVLDFRRVEWPSTV